MVRAYYWSGSEVVEGSCYVNQDIAKGGGGAKVVGVGVVGMVVWQC